MKPLVKKSMLTAAVIIIGTLASVAEPLSSPVKPQPDSMDISSLLILIGGCLAVVLIAWFSWHGADRSKDTLTRKKVAVPSRYKDHIHHHHHGHGLNVHHSR